MLTVGLLRVHKTTFVPSFLVRQMYDILDRQGWCQHHMAQDRDGVPCFVEDKNVWYFGLVGAFYYVRDKYPQVQKHDQAAIEMVLKALNKRNSAEGKIKVPSDIIKDRAAKSDEWKFHWNKFNDEPGRTKMEVLRLLREAMED